MPLEDIVVGREPEDLKKFGKAGTIFLGKHVVGSGFDSNLTNPIRMDVARPHVVLILGKRGSGKCLDGDSLIPLGDGSVVPIKELALKESDIWAADEKLKIVKSKKTEFFERDVDALLRIKLRSGKEIKLTPEHPLLTILGWKLAEELKIGSRIATPRKIGDFGNQKMRECEIKLLAYLLAEGHMSNNFVVFSNFDEKIFLDFSDAVKNFDSSLRIVEHSKPGCYRVTKSEEEIKITDSIRNQKGEFVERKSFLSLWLHKLGIYGKLSPEKFIPPCIFKSPKEQLALFLNRLFSCDGSVYKHKTTHGSVWEISYSSASEVLIKQVQHLLLRFGILSRVRKKKTKLNEKIFDNFELEIGPSGLINFIGEIGFFGGKADKQKMALQETEERARNPNVDTIPKEIWDFYKPQNWAAVGRALGYSTFPKAARESQFYSPSREKLLQIAVADGAERIKLIAESDIFWDEIVEMEKMEGKFRVYDIAVPELHNFVANDIIVHNSYTGAVIAEEIMNQPEEIRQNLSALMIDTMGIFWSMKNPNDPALLLLREWELQPQGFAIKNFIPAGMENFYRASAISFDKTFSILPSELSAGDWALTFEIELLSPLGILLERVLKKVPKNYTIENLIGAIESDRKADEKEKLALENRFYAAEGWGIFSSAATKAEDFLIPGTASVLDVSLMDFSVRNLLVGIFSRKIYEARTAARRQEETALIAGQELKKVPMTWVIIDEAHNFLPSVEMTAATEPLLTLARQGRQPGISLALITQRPNKLHEDAIAQADLIISHRLTSKSDVDALSSVMQTYLLEDIKKSIADMPKSKGAAVILDDNSERLFGIQIRPRQSWHAGGSPIALKEKRNY